MTLFLARHGETDWNRAGKLQGRLGAPLNEVGREQSRALARAARSLGVRAVITSPLLRALETARIVARELDCVATPCEALMELDFGECTGLTEPEIDERFPGLRERRKLDKWRHRWPGGESYRDALGRVDLALRTGELPGAPLTLLVAHQSINRVVARALCGLPAADALAMTQRSDVLLRFEAGVIAHASIARAGDGVVWKDGPYRGALPNLN
jgi:probable phosphoglycerate mutase